MNWRSVPPVGGFRPGMSDATEVGGGGASEESDQTANSINPNDITLNANEEMTLTPFKSAVRIGA